MSPTGAWCGNNLSNNGGVVFAPSFTYINIYKTILTIKSKHLIDKCGKIRYHIVAGRDTLYTREIELTFKRHVMSAEHEDAAPL